MKKKGGSESEEGEEDGVKEVRRPMEWPME